MTWGGSYSGMALQSVSVVNLTRVGTIAPILGLLLSESSPPPPTCPVISNGGFESGRTVWTSYSSHGWDLILNSGFPGSVSPHSGSWAVWLGGEFSDESYIQQSVTVSAACPYLVFYHWIASADSCNYDYGYININGTNIETVNLCTTNDTGGWTVKSVNLIAYNGQMVTLRLRVTTNGTNNSNWFIDDVYFSSTGVSNQRETSGSRQSFSVKEKAAFTKSTISKIKNNF